MMEQSLQYICELCRCESGVAGGVMDLGVLDILGGIYSMHNTNLNVQFNAADLVYLLGLERGRSQ